jgi:predicted RNA-binding Zn-ribbon protein involved in translation (DUF1610 family)
MENGEEFNALIRNAIYCRNRVIIVLLVLMCFVYPLIMVFRDKFAKYPKLIDGVGMYSWAGFGAYYIICIWKLFQAKCPQCGERVFYRANWFYIRLTPLTRECINCGLKLEVSKSNQA